MHIYIYIYTIYLYTYIYIYRHVRWVGGSQSSLGRVSGKRERVGETEARRARRAGGVKPGARKGAQRARALPVSVGESAHIGISGRMLGNRRRAQRLSACSTADVEK